MMHAVSILISPVISADIWLAIADTLEKCKGEMLWNVMGLPSDLRLHKKPGEKKIKKRDLTFIHPFLSHTQWRRDGELSSSDEESDGPSTGSRGAPYGKTQPHAQPAKSIRPSKHGMVLNPRPKLIKTNSTRSITTNQVVAATRLNRIQPVPLTTAQPEGNVNGESSKNQKHMHKCSKYILTQSPDLSTIPESCSSRSQSQAATEELTADTKNDETTAEEDGWSDIANVSRSDRKKKQKASPNGTVDTKAPSASTSRQENDEPAPPAIRHVNFDPLIPHVKKPTIAAAISSHDRPAPPPTNGISESLARLELNGEVQRVRKQPQQGKPRVYTHVSERVVWNTEVRWQRLIRRIALITSVVLTLGLAMRRLRADRLAFILRKGLGSICMRLLGALVPN